MSQNTAARTVTVNDHGKLDIRALVLLAILLVRPNIGQALVIGLISAAVIQITTTSPFIDFAAEGISAMVMAAIVAAGELAAAMLPVVAATAVFNAILVQALYIPIKKALKLDD